VPFGGHEVKVTETWTPSWEELVDWLASVNPGTARETRKDKLLAAFFTLLENVPDDTQAEVQRALRRKTDGWPES
jgi:hypothetical protein